jgi:hypothetical protein
MARVCPDGSIGLFVQYAGAATNFLEVDSCRYIGERFTKVVAYFGPGDLCGIRLRNFRARGLGAPR